MLDADATRMVMQDAEVQQLKQRLAQAENFISQLIPVVLSFVGVNGGPILIPFAALQAVPRGTILHLDAGEDEQGPALKVHASRAKKGSGIVGADGREVPPELEPWPPPPIEVK